jgi:DNA repair exonuclease SbcCD nuclease subunit
MSSFTFFHAADLHLGTPFQGIEAEAAEYPRVTSLLQRAPFAAFDALLRMALEERPAFLLIAGDVFETRDRSVRAELHFHAGLKRLAAVGIECFVVHGNHDPVSSDSLRLTWPDGVHIFGAEKVRSVVARDARQRAVATVSGISYRDRREGRKLHEQLRRAGAALAADKSVAGLFHLALLHCNAGGATGHAPYVACTVAELARADFDYWALGHVHARGVLHAAPWVVYPGNIQGRHARETGARGFYRVRVRAREEATFGVLPAAGTGRGWRVEPEFIACDMLRWEALDVSLDGVATVDAVEEAIARALEGATAEDVDDGRAEAAGAAAADVAAADTGGGGRPRIVRLELRGRTPLAMDLQRPELRRELLERARVAGMRCEPFIWPEGLNCRCRPLLDTAERARAGDLLGQILRIAEELRRDPEALEKALHAAADPLFDHSLLRRELLFPDGPEREQLLAAAALRCIDLLDDETVSETAPGAAERTGGEGRPGARREEGAG